MARILVVDDEVEVRKLITLMLSGSGHEVVCIVGTQLKDFERQDFDLIITDMMMPEIDGLQVIENMRRVRPDIGIIAISGAPWKNEYGPLDVAIRRGANHVIPKPFRRAELLTAVNELLSRRTPTVMSP